MTMNSDPTIQKRKLRPLVITLGSKRKSYIEKIFNEPCMKEHFEPPTFSPGIFSRELRGCYSFLRHASKTGIIPQHEWDAIAKAKQDRVNDENKDDNDHLGLLDCLNDVPVLEGRRGSKEDVEKHYCRELWQKAKGINRGRNVLACLFAHLVAMKTLVEEDYDFILEDNVRAPIFNCDHDEDDEEEDDRKNNRPPPCAIRIREAIEASQELEIATGTKCHLRYFGWLGSRTNLEFIINKHCPRTRYKREGLHKSISVFPFPVTSDIDIEEDTCVESNDNKIPTLKEEEELDEKSGLISQKKPGGTLMWGAYAYWVSKEGHQALIQSLQNDVGSLLWKGKRMRHHVVKPIDKVMPRKIMAAFSPSDQVDEGRECVHVATDPAFFRAPMLTSQIHSQWDSEFCRSTEFQMLSCWKGKNSVEKANEDVWDSLWLTDLERQVIAHKKVTKEWLTLDQLSTKSMQNN